MNKRPTSGLLSESAVVILCGGKGTRMGSDTRHKVCFPIDGVPAIIRTVKTFQDNGVKKIVIVVGALAENVISTVGQQFPNVMYVYQSQQLGTGHAAQIGTNALRQLGFAGPIMITMGDKLIESTVIDHTAEIMLRQRADMVFVTGSKKQNPGAGRIVVSDGKILGNIEERDIQLARILAQLSKFTQGANAKKITFDQMTKIGQKFIPNQSKLEKALGPIATQLKKSGEMSVQNFIKLLPQHAGLIKLAKQAFSADQVERTSKTVNLSLYLGKSEFWYEMLPNLENNNAQKEYYLPDVITMVGNNVDCSWRLQQYQITDNSDVMAFNSPDELLMIEDTIRRKNIAIKKSETGLKALPTAIGKIPDGSMRKAGKWLELFESWPARLRQNFIEIYGPDKNLIEDRKQQFISALKLFVRRYGKDRDAIIVRAPGRINLLGRHVDHRGGAVNVLAIDRDVIFVASPRTDDVVRMCNVHPQKHPDREFSIGQLLGEIEWQDWTSFVNSEYVRRIIAQTRGDWSNYVKAALLRLQQSFQHVRIMGFDSAIIGDIPQAAGLSSSSALVVASMEIATAFNGLDVSSSELIDLCGQGEWFVGSRGGSADHAAIRMGRRGQIAHVKFFPFEISKIYTFPDDCKLVIANSGIDAQKSASAKDKFNQRVASYEFGFMLLRDRNPHYDNLLEHLRDVNPRRLHCTISQIYKLLLTIPENLPTETLRELLSNRHSQKVERILSSHTNPGSYELRSVLLYGIAECERSLMAPQLLSKNDIETFGQLMNISHDGDRVGIWKNNGKSDWQPNEYFYDVSNQAIEILCQNLASEDPARVLDAQLYMQPGGYGCSTRQIDKMVDVVKNIPGCYGAQLGGAGLGGCIMILVKTDSTDRVIKSLKKFYYEPSDIQPMIHVCQPVQGSGIISI